MLKTHKNFNFISCMDNNFVSFAYKENENFVGT